MKHLFLFSSLSELYGVGDMMGYPSRARQEHDAPRRNPHWQVLSILFAYRHESTFVPNHLAVYRINAASTATTKVKHAPSHSCAQPVQNRGDSHARLFS